MKKSLSISPPPRKLCKLQVVGSLLVASLLGFSQNIYAVTATLSKDGIVDKEIDSTNLAELGTGLESGQVITIYQDINSNAQFSGNAVGATGTVTIQSATSDTQYTITTNGAQRFCDFAHGIYNLTDLRFYNCGKTTDGGGVFYRNDGAESTSTFNMDNILFEECFGTNGAVLRAAAGMTLSGVYSFKNSAVHSANEGAVYAMAGSVNFTGNSSNATFTGTTAGGDYQVYDVKASEDINFTGTGTYSFNTGLTAKKLNINGSSVTLEAGSKSSFSNEVRVESGTLTLKSGNFTTPSFLLGPGATIAIATPTLTINNLDSTAPDAGAVVKVADGYTDEVTLTLSFTNTPIYRGAIQMGDNTVIKTGTGTVTSEQGIEAGNLIIREGTVKLASKDANLLKVTGDVTLDGGAIEFSSSYGSTHSALESDGKKFYVTEKGGSIKVSGNQRGFIQNGVHSAEGVQSGNLTFYDGRVFVVGNSTFNGYYELVSGATHFSQSGVASSKGIILNGGILQYLGEDILGNSDRTLSCPIYLKNTSSIQAGWSSNFMVNGNISDYEGVNMTGKTLTVNKDSGNVYFNGNVNTKAILSLSDAVATNGTNNLVFGGLAGTRTFTNTATNASDKTLTLNVAESAPAEFTGTISGLFNLVKTGQGTQTFSTTGIGTNNSSLNRVTVSEGTLAVTNNAPIYAKTIKVDENGSLQFGTGTYSVTTDSLEVLGDIVLTFASADDYTKLNVTTTPSAIKSNGFLTFAMSGDYQLEEGVDYLISDIFPDLGVDFNYDLLLADSYKYNLNYFNNGLVLSVDSGAVPEPTTWVMLLAGLAGLGVLTRKSRKG